jgi:hypothetical protein
LEFLKLLNIAQSASVPNREAVAIELSPLRGSIRKAFEISESSQYRVKRIGTEPRSGGSPLATGVSRWKLRGHDQPHRGGSLIPSRRRRQGKLVKRHSKATASSWHRNCCKSQ